jgi:hypothetical protein
MKSITVEELQKAVDKGSLSKEIFDTIWKQGVSQGAWIFHKTFKKLIKEGLRQGCPNEISIDVLFKLMDDALTVADLSIEEFKPENKGPLQ